MAKQVYSSTAGISLYAAAKGARVRNAMAMAALTYPLGVATLTHTPWVLPTQVFGPRNQTIVAVVGTPAQIDIEGDVVQ